jgi:hypothetical protein
VLAGDDVAVVHRPTHGVTIREAFEGRRGGHLEALQRLRAEGEDLDPNLVAQLDHEIELATR